MISKQVESAGSGRVTVYNSKSLLRQPLKLLIEIMGDLWRCRELTWTLFIRDLKAQYRQSLMGYFWLLVPPLMTMLVWYFLNSQRIIQVETEVPYPLFVLIGTSIWTSFASMTQQPLQGFIAGKPVFMKLKVAPEAFILSRVLRAFFELAVRVSLIIPLFILFDFSPPITWLFFPLAVFSVASVALAFGLILVPIGSLYSDIGTGVGSAMGILMYTTPVVFPIPESGLLSKIMLLNPATPGIALCRDLLVNGSLIWLPGALVYTGISVVIMIFALIAIRVSMPHLVQRMGM